MHYVDRDSVISPPLEKLSELNKKYKKSWITYNLARANNLKPLPPKPMAGWLCNEVKKPLKELFLKNCGYCGFHADEGRDAEVDHFFPTSRDLKADHIFDWENYIWSCPSCNGKKSNNLDFLNPCSESDVKNIYFHANDGRYLYYQSSTKELIDKYNQTEKFTNLNDKNRPDHRKHVYKSLTNIILPKMYQSFLLKVHR